MPPPDELKSTPAKAAKPATCPNPALDPSFDSKTKVVDEVKSGACFFA